MLNCTNDDTRVTILNDNSDTVTIPRSEYVQLLLENQRMRDAMRIAPSYGRTGITLSMDLRPWCADLQCACAEMQRLMPDKVVTFSAARLMSSDAATVYDAGDMFCTIEDAKSVESDETEEDDDHE